MKMENVLRWAGVLLSMDVVSQCGMMRNKLLALDSHVMVLELGLRNS